MSPVAALRADLAAGFGLLTRLPVGWLAPAATPYRPGRAVWTYPVVGALLGAIAACCLWAGNRTGLSHALIACWTLTALVLLTGSLHEDGLADMADGFGGGRTPVRRLEIMRDSRIGSFGALALVLSLAIRGTALAEIAAMPARRAACVLIAIGALSRAAMLPVLWLPPARPDGLARSLGTLSPVVGIAALATALLVAIMTIGPGPGVGFALTALTIGAGVAALARARIGGRSGDVLGACVVVVDCSLLTLATLR